MPTGKTKLMQLAHSDKRGRLFEDIGQWNN